MALVVVAGIGLPVMVALAAVLAVVPGMAWYLAIPIGLVVSALIVWLKVRNPVDSVLRKLGCDDADEDSEPRLFNIVSGLSLSGGISEPTLMVLADEARNVAVLDGGGRSVVVFTSGILDSVDRIGLEALAASAITRIRDGDASAATAGVALFGRLVSGPFGGIAEPLVSLGLRKLLGADRDLLCDQKAVLLTRYPPGLVAALDVMSQGSICPAGATKANDHIWLAAPSGELSDSAAMVPHAALDLRMAVLEEL